MGIGDKDIKILWGRAAGKCSMCKNTLFHEASNPSDTTLIGENCHIVGDKPGSARSNDPSLSDEDRDRYPNLILLCRNHHKIIDGDEKTFSVGKLHQIKAEHELWVESAFAATEGPDSYYGDVVELAVNCLLLKDWDWFSDNALRNLVSAEFVDGAGKFTTYIWRAVWPGTRPELEDELKNLAVRVDAYVTHFCSNAYIEQKNFKWWFEDKSYKKTLNPRYHEFADYSEKWVTVGHQLLFNLVVALNTFADVVRKELNSMFLISYGRFTVNDTMGVMNELVPTHFRPEKYRNVEAMPKKPEP